MPIHYDNYLRIEIISRCFYLKLEVLCCNLCTHCIYLFTRYVAFLTIRLHGTGGIFFNKKLFGAFLKVVFMKGFLLNLIS